MHESYSSDMRTSCLNSSTNVPEKPAKSIYRVENGHKTFLRQSSKFEESTRRHLLGDFKLNREYF